MLNTVETELRAYQEALAAETKAQAQARAREEEARRREEEAREKVQRLVQLEGQEGEGRTDVLEPQLICPLLQRLEEEKARTAKEAALQAAEARRQEEEAKATAAADAQKHASEQRQQRQRAVEKEAALAAQQFLRDAQARVQRLDVIQARSKQILESPDPAVKRIRVDIKIQVRESGIIRTLMSPLVWSG